MQLYPLIKLFEDEIMFYWHISIGQHVLEFGLLFYSHL